MVSLTKMSIPIFRGHFSKNVFNDQIFEIFCKNRFERQLGIGKGQDEGGGFLPSCFYTNFPLPPHSVFEKSADRSHLVHNQAKKKIIEIVKKKGKNHIFCKSIKL